MPYKELAIKLTLLTFDLAVNLTQASEHDISLYCTVFQEVMDMRHDETIAHVHLIVSIVETVITLCVIVVLMLNARTGYIKVKQVIQRLELVADLVGDAQLRSIRTWMWLLVAVGCLYLVACTACFFVFHHLSHLGWTLLSNQVFIITLTMLIGLYTGRVAATVVKIKEDHHKVPTDNMARPVCV